MKTTGIVRRIDDLGRVAVPKEIRRVFKIREGDPLEIYITSEGILFKKYSPIGELGDFAKEYAESLYESTEHIVLITDRDNIVAVSGGSKKDYLDKQIGSVVEDCITMRKQILQNETREYIICHGLNTEYSSFVVSPIYLEGDAIGSVILLNTNDEIKMGQLEVKMVETAAGFLSKQMG